MWPLYGAGCATMPTPTQSIQCLSSKSRSRDIAFDRTYKSSLYARAGRPEYWIVNLVDRVLEVHRAPALSPSAPYGWDYTVVEVRGAGDVVSPLAAMDAPIAVADLLP